MISQALQMEGHGVPNDQLYNLNPIFVLILLPVWEKWLFPRLNRSSRLQPISRIAIGFIFVAAAMGYEIVVQVLIYRSPPCYSHPLACTQPGPNKINVAIQVPTYFLLAISETLMNASAMEYAYTRAPPAMKSLMQAVFAFMWALGSICGIALSPLSHDPYLAILFSVLCGASLFATILFWYCFREEIASLFLPVKSQIDSGAEGI